MTEEQAVLGHPSGGEEPEPAVSAFLSPYVFDAPLKKRRLLFNDTHSLAVNQLHKTGETGRLRLNAGYTSHRLREQRGSETTYYRQTDSLRINEQRDSRLRQHTANLCMQIEDNAENRFLTNLCQLSGDWQTAEADIQATPAPPDATPRPLEPTADLWLARQPDRPQTRQQIRTPGLRIGNLLHGLWNREGYTFEIHSRLRYSDRAEGWTLKGVFSKGFYDWGLKTSLSLTGYSGRDAGWSEGSLLPVRNRYLECAPKIGWSPWPRVEATYEAVFRYGGSTVERAAGGTSAHLTPLWHIEQQAQIRYEIYPFGISLTADHSHNDLEGGQAAGIGLADLAIDWTNEKWDVSASATNLFDKKEYRYTQYTALQQSTSWLRIRPREFLLTAAYRF